MTVNIGERIRFFRKRRRLTQQQLADQLHVTQIAVHHWENGIREPKYSVLYQICLILKVSMAELFEEQPVEAVGLDDQENLKLIWQALWDYKDGALIEARDALAAVVERIDAFITKEEGEA